MYCTNCGKKIDDDSGFCIFCGQRVSSELDIAEDIHVSTTPSATEHIGNTKTGQTKQQEAEPKNTEVAIDSPSRKEKQSSANKFKIPIALLSIIVAIILISLTVVLLQQVGSLQNIQISETTSDNATVLLGTPTSTPKPAPTPMPTLTPAPTPVPTHTPIERPA